MKNNKLDMARLNKILISIIGPHAGESYTNIFDRKIQDINKNGFTIWLINSYKSSPQIIKSLEKAPTHVLFIAPSTRSGAKPTTCSNLATHYTILPSNQTYTIPSGLSPVTGKITKNSCGLMLTELYMLEKETRYIDLNKYADCNNLDSPIKFKLGCSTICAEKKNMNDHPDKLKSNIRKIIGIGKLHRNLGVLLHSNTS